jgi:hypothetical protein
VAVQSGDILQVRAKMSYGADEVMNVWHVKADFDTEQSEEDVYNAINAWIDDIYDNIDQYISTGMSFDTIEVINLTQENTLGEDAWDTLTAGTAASNTLPRQTQALVRFITSTLGSQGRKYIPGFCEDENLGSGSLSSAAQTALAAFAAEALSYAVISVGNYIIPGNWNPTLSRFVEWASAVVNPYMATLRKRSVTYAQ